jgi:RNA polymerase sigma-70 factor (ECF subfamily)
MDPLKIADPSLPLPPDAADEELVCRVKAGDKGLFEVLMRRYNQRLFRVTRAILRDDAEAEDVMQQAYLNAYAHLDQFAGRSSCATWLTRIAVHEASARARRRRSAENENMRDPDEDAAASLPDGGPDPEAQLLAGEVRGLLEAAIDALPERYRCTFVLREVEGLGTAEAAESLGISEELVKTRLYRARALLRDELCRRAGNEIGRTFSFHLSRCDRVVSAVMGLLPSLEEASRTH